MTMGTEGSSSSEALHNFRMPTGLRWGNRKFLRCMKVNADGQISAVERKPTSSYSSFGGDGFTQMIRSQTVKDGSWRSDKKREMGLSFRPPLPPGKRLKVMEGVGVSVGVDDENGIAAVREKMIFGLRTEADKINDSILKKENFVDDVSESPAAEDGVRPWNLRTRRAALKFEGCAIGGNVFVSGGGVAVEKNHDIVNPKSNPFKTSPLRVTGETTPRLRGVTAVAAAAASPSREKKERSKLSVHLTRREIEEDFMTIVGHKPQRRPKKRAKNLQKTIDTLLPGLWLTEITPDLYKVPKSQ